MKTIKEQIEIIRYFDDGGALLEDCYDKVTIINKKEYPNYQFDFAENDYKIHKEAKPLFPTKEQGAKYYVSTEGLIFKIGIDFCDLFVSHLVRQGRTFYTLEDAEAFVRREQAKVYCLEAINRVNEGDNGFKDDKGNYILLYDMSVRSLDIHLEDDVRAQEANECIRTEEATQELINDAEFVENWKIFKGVE